MKTIFVILAASALLVACWAVVSAKQAKREAANEIYDLDQRILTLEWESEERRREMKKRDDDERTRALIRRYSTIPSQ